MYVVHMFYTCCDYYCTYYVELFRSFIKQEKFLGRREDGENPKCKDLSSPEEKAKREEAMKENTTPPSVGPIYREKDHYPTYKPKYKERTIEFGVIVDKKLYQDMAVSIPFSD